MRKLMLCLLLILGVVWAEGQTVKTFSVLQWNIWQEGTVVPGGYKAIVEEIDLNFFWMPELVQTLRYYESHRRKYPAFASFWPEIVRFFDNYVADREKQISKAMK